MGKDENQVNVDIQERELFSSRLGFILASVGSAVGMGNVWLFPTRVSMYGGGTFIIPYLIFVILIGFTGLIGEMGLGRSTRGTPVRAFAKAMESRGKSGNIGRILGYIPTIASLLLAIGYTVVMSWILKYTLGTITGSIFSYGNIDEFGSAFASTASPFGNTIWVIITILLTFIIMRSGVKDGIETANKFMTPLFFVLFLILAIYIATLPGATEGYRYIFTFNLEGLLDPIVWIFALGQAFFSLSLGGSGTVTYGSYLDDDEDILYSARIIALFDVTAALLAALVIIPAMATTGSQLSEGGPGLLFIHLPNLFSNMTGGRIVSIIFFVAMAFAGLSSIVNLYETSIAALQDEFDFSRAKSTIAIGGLGLLVSLFIQGIVGEWMDIVSIYINPIGAALAAVMFYWVFDTDYTRNELEKGRDKEIGGWLEPMTKYLFVGLTIFVYIAGVALGGIG